MLGPNTALADLPASPPLLPASAFGRRGSLPRKPPGPINDEAEVSKRPFARPKRVPVSRPPLRGCRSRPASLTSRRIRSRPVRLPTPRLAPVYPVRGGSAPATRRHDLFRHSGWLSRSCSPSGSSDPSGSALAPVHPRKLASAFRPVPFAPRWSKFGNSPQRITVPGPPRSAWLAVP
jgi:hypothetical protein